MSCPSDYQSIHCPMLVRLGSLNRRRYVGHYGDEHIQHGPSYGFRCTAPSVICFARHAMCSSGYVIEQWNRNPVSVNQIVKELLMPCPSHWNVTTCVNRTVNSDN